METIIKIILMLMILAVLVYYSNKRKVSKIQVFKIEVSPLPSQNYP